MTSLLTVGPVLCEPITFSPVELRAALGEILTDITPGQLEDRLDWLMKLRVPNLAELQDLYLGHDCVIAGSGPSLDAEYIAARQAQGARIIAINCTHDWLIERGIIPDFGVMLDPNLRVAGYMTPHRRVTYLLGASCDRAVWLKFFAAGIKPFMFFPIMTDTQHENVARKYPNDNICCIAGGPTVGIRTPNIAGWMGFQTPEIHAYDSCYETGKNGSDESGLYAVTKPKTLHDAREITIVSKATGDKFTCVTNGPMARQIISFQNMNAQLPDSEVHGRLGFQRVRVSGYGAIPWMAWKDGGPDKYIEHVNPEGMAAKYGNAKHWDNFKGAPR